MKRTIAGLALIGSLLLIGAGCAAGPQPGAQAPGAAGGPSAQGVNQQDAVDAAASAYASGATDEQTAVKSETDDTSALNSTDTELNAYGQAYDKSEL